MIRTLVAFGVFAAALVAQPRVSLENQGTHVLCVVPMVGTGTPADPMRPMFTPLPPAPGTQGAVANSTVQPAQGDQSAQPPQPATAPVAIIPKPPIISMQYQLSDDGKMALVDFAGSSIDAIKPILNSTDPNVKGCFLRDASTKAQIESAFKQFKSSFTLNSFVPGIAASAAQGKPVTK